MSGVMKIVLLTLCVLAAASIAAADQTWTGEISDSACGANHEAAAEGADRMSNRECTLACVRGGSKYVLLSGGAVLAIANQDFGALAAKAGQTVKVTGALNNGAITVTKIDNPD